MTSFPGHFENMVKTLEETNGGESRRVLAGSGLSGFSPGPYYSDTLCHIPLFCMPGPSLGGLPALSETRSIPPDSVIVTVSRKESAPPFLQEESVLKRRREGFADS